MESGDIITVILFGHSMVDICFYLKFSIGLTILTEEITMTIIKETTMVEVITVQMAEKFTVQVLTPVKALGQVKINLLKIA